MTPMQSRRLARVPAGVVRDNAVLLERNDPDNRKLTQTRGQS